MIQEPFTYDEQYFENIREFKKSKHTMSYVYYAAWAPLEGLTGYKDPASWGERIVGLPDSLVVVAAGTLGDLVESCIKREMQIKDSGNFLPGHGGFLDRFDSTLLAVPAVVVYLALLGLL